MASRMWVIYSGQWLSESVFARRGLTVRNAAAFKRITNVCGLIEECGWRVTVISRAYSMSMRSAHLVDWGHVQRIGVRTCAVFPTAICRRGLLFRFVNSGLWLATTSLQLLRGPEVFMVYNYSLSNVIACLVARILSVRVITEIEDIPVVRDFSRGSAGSWLNSYLAFISFQIQVRLSHGVLAASEEFLKHIPCRRRVVLGGLARPGSISAKVRAVTGRSVLGRTRHSVLWCGKLSNAFGAQLVLELIRSGREIFNEITLDICGEVPDPSTLEEFRRAACGNVNFHGFVSDSQFDELLRQCTICLSLQDPSVVEGTQIPSKIYEFLAAGKFVIASMSNVDIAETCPVFLLEHFEWRCLRDAILSIAALDDVARSAWQARVSNFVGANYWGRRNMAIMQGALGKGSAG